MATKDKKPERNVVSKAELKDVVKERDKILEQKEDQVGSSGGVPGTYTKIRLSSGAILETFGEGYGRATNSR
jgi:hypothetical protein